MNNQPYPHRVGDFTAIGPECIASTPEPGPGTVINWRGAHFESRPESALRSELERMLADDTANIGWVHGQRVFTEEQVRHVLRFAAELDEVRS